MKNRCAVLIAFVVITPALALPDSAAQLMADPSFESQTPGALPSGGSGAVWEIQRTGRASIQDRLGVACVEDEAQARTGQRCLALSIPRETEGFEFVTAGQRLQLSASKEYEASIWARWADGPDSAPRGASATEKVPSAIVSFWARHSDGTGDFAGRDEWLFDNRWRRLAFRFRATDPGQPTLVYVSLLPNQQPAATTVLVDDFELSAMDGVTETDPRAGNLVEDAGFDAQRPSAIVAPWGFANMGGKGISLDVGADKNQQWLTFKMPGGTSNFESAQLWQHIDLRRGWRYEIGCRLRWDNYTPGAPAPIVNFGIYHEESGTWYGPIDQTLDKSGDWIQYKFLHAPPYGGHWKLYVQLNGWGNAGRAIGVSVDDVACMPERLPWR